MDFDTFFSELEPSSEEIRNAPHFVTEYRTIFRIFCPDCGNFYELDELPTEDEACKCLNCGFVWIHET